MNRPIATEMRLYWGEQIWVRPALLRMEAAVVFLCAPRDSSINSNDPSQFFFFESGFDIGNSKAKIKACLFHVLMICPILNRDILTKYLTVARSHHIRRGTCYRRGITPLRLVMETHHTHCTRLLPPPGDPSIEAPSPALSVFPPEDT